EALEAAVVETVEPVGGSHPDVSAAVPADRARKRRAVSAGQREETRRAVGVVDQPAHRRDPETARAVSRERHRRARESVLYRPHLETAVGEMPQTRRNAEPEAAAVVLEDVADAFVGESLVLSEQRHLVSPNVREPVGRTDPERAVSRLDESRDRGALERR